MNERPAASAVLSTLKDFQRDTVEHAFRRLWTDADRTRRFLVADEVGLGKTMVAKGVIAKTVEHLWETVERIDIVYICSNAQIARQNLGRLNAVGGNELRHADRLTMLPKVIRDLRRQKVNFVSFTPGTSFNVGQRAGKAEERVLLFWMLTRAWGGEVRYPAKWKRFFEGWVSRERFERMLRDFDEKQLDGELCDTFAEEIEKAEGPAGGALADELRECVEDFRYLRDKPARTIRLRRDTLVGRLRHLVARASVTHLEPDLIILDEFQRFKDLLRGEDDPDTFDEGVELANALMDHPDARVLMLSATPYKMYTLPDEPEGDDHYRDFTRTIAVLGGQARAERVENGLRTMREAMVGGGDLVTARTARDRVEHELRKIMSRTERLAATPDRDGMLAGREMPGATVTASDLRVWLQFDQIARLVDRHDVFEYWRSTPYPLGIMERGSYQFRRGLEKAIEEKNPQVTNALRDAHLLTKASIHSYEQVDPGNAKMRGLMHEVLDRGTWQLAWIAPSLPYYDLGGAYADPRLRSFTKCLAFSAWTVVPKAIATLVSYEAERRAVEASGSGRGYTDRVARPLQFRVDTDGREAGMPVLALMYPSLALARAGDPLTIARMSGRVLSAPEMRDAVAARIRELLNTLQPSAQAESSAGAGTDQRWYWAAPLLLDRLTQGDEHAPFEAILTRLGEATSGDIDDEDGGESVSGSASLVQHLKRASDVRITDLGPRPGDLVDVLTSMALAAPGVTALRALSRISGGDEMLGDVDVRRQAFAVAEGLRSLFNRPEIITLLRAEHEDGYWHTVLQHGFDGCLQAVLDEYAHVLIEQCGLQDADGVTRAREVSTTMVAALSTRSAPSVFDDFQVDEEGVHTEQYRVRSHFAARLGDALTPASEKRGASIRTAFNSPFRPFVLATTSVGQEGLDFHTYSHAVVHWNLPSNPVDLEQREGRVHRYKGHAVRKNIAAVHGAAGLGCDADDPWAAMFGAAVTQRGVDASDITPFWVFAPPGGAVIERYVPAQPLSRESAQLDRLQRTVGAYRLVMGQPRQEDLLRYIGEHDGAFDSMRIDLSPPKVSAADGPEVALVTEV